MPYATPSNHSRPDIELGSYLYEIWLAGNSWVKRRVETVDFLGAGSLRRRVSVDFQIPDSEFLYGVSPRAVPLALLEKRPLVDFDITDESGSVLPIGTRAENCFAAWSMLAAAASVEIEYLDVDVALLDIEDLWNDLRVIAFGEPAAALQMLSSFETTPDPIRSGLAASSYFDSVARTLAALFMLLVPVRGTPGDRRVIKFQYIEVLNRLGSGWERFTETMGWKPARFEFGAPAVGESESYHFEVAAPADLQVARSVLVLEDPLAGKTAVEGTSTGSRAHLYVTGQEPDVDGTALMGLRLSKAGLLRSGCVVAGMVFAVLLLFFAAGFLDNKPRDIQSAILLALPALVATLIVRPGEHGLATELLLGVRSAVALAGGVAYTAALFLGLGIRGEPLYTSWKVFLGIAGLCFGSLFLAFWACKRDSSAERPITGAL